MIMPTTTSQCSNRDVDKNNFCKITTQMNLTINFLTQQKRKCHFLEILRNHRH
eukprot:m.10433 g.10433  ORF g.10433 m.10433 type:complete len:53 (+) comp8300_c0_seq2:1007-1165(+)